MRGDMTVELGPLHPRHGPHQPTRGGPPRVPGSVRRTSTIDMLRPEGNTGPLVLRGRARDLGTKSAGAVVLGEASAEAMVDYPSGRTLRTLTTTPSRPVLGELVGRSVASGFRRAVLKLDPRLPAENGLLNLLLDDFPVATLVSGHAVVASTPFEQRRQRVSGLHGNLVRDQCAGFISGGTIMAEVDRCGVTPVVTGPVAPPLVDEHDPEGWHTLEPLPPHAMRRARRMDIRPGTPTVVDVLFRDSHVRADGLEVVVHEYTVAAEIDTGSGTVLSCTATPQVLPWVECPAAAASATRLAGLPLAGLRQHIRATFTGTSTCTHLNDTLRSLEDVAALLPLVNPSGVEEPNAST